MPRKPQEPEELRILVHESMRADLQRRITRRQALMTAGTGALALYVAACGGSSGEQAERPAAPGGGEKPSVPADAPIEDRLLVSNWVDYTDPANYKAYTKDLGPKVTISGYGSNDELLAKLRAGGAKFDIVAPTGYAVKTMIDQGLALKLNHELIPNLKNLQPAFRNVEYDRGNHYSIPKDYGITSFYWLTEKMGGTAPKTIRECFDFLKTADAKPLRVNFLEGGTQVAALALKALGYSLNSEDEGEIEEAKQLLLDVKPNVDTVNSTFIERASRGDIDFGMGWNGDIRRAIQALEKKDRELVFLVPEDSTEYWVDNWVVPKDAEHPVAAHKWLNFILEPENAAREMDYHQYAVPVQGVQELVDPELAQDPLINIPNETIERYETQLQTARGLQQRERLYTEFKAA